jgi:hypothetical protein
LEDHGEKSEEFLLGKEHLRVAPVSTVDWKKAESPPTLPPPVQATTPLATAVSTCLARLSAAASEDSGLS